MKLLFIRHSLAVDREEFIGHDFDRPLTEKGKKRARKFFRVIKKIYPHIDIIITSKAKRALQTAEILKEFYDCEFEITSKLYPGANINDLKEVLEEKVGIIAIVGHEPDLSEMIKSIMHAPNLKIKLQKPSLVEIEENVIKGLFQYKHFRELNE
ncbi:phosphohistidine phosphatase [Caminibacter mediatlanticus TB-2]|uniref:Phosphohistidine phosphatase n=1 Tax=Caminibacter mediatlanticus TB-2 TaxID=391592 RepID=A0AAI9AIV0_9BACT|nr:histidine phosphatase family protein [Caminibacter mediatlanticus]EDM24307.1 phosphohistidine phosphatase SixA [Caminibacter mediatlanticus TB-2]QCT94952.1 phosphohistidine phosphatase [Caminibacter mediatlanticus TB-2]